MIHHGMERRVTVKARRVARSRTGAVRRESALLGVVVSVAYAVPQSATATLAALGYELCRGASSVVSDELVKAP